MIWILSILVLISCGKKLEKQAVQQIRTMDSLQLPKDAIEIEEITESGDFAIAEVQIHTAFKLKRVNDEWVIDEVRLGDRRWEKYDRLVKALNLERTAATRSKLTNIRSAIQEFEAETGRVPQVSNFEALVDTLAPRFMAEVIRIDDWWNPFSYTARGEKEFVLKSAGPDGTLDTVDDITVENHEAKTTLD